jgi:hypothetical protein
MTNFSRRQFLGGMVSAAATVAAGRIFPVSPAPTERPFEILAVGDSLMSAQGLRPTNKFSWLVKEWVERDLFAGTRQVNYKTKAHSGARISLHPEEEAQMLRLGDDSQRFHHPEINISFPCIGTQIETARREYADPGTVDLILISGGITDILVANVVNPFLKKERFVGLIEQYCHAGMTGLLKKAAAIFPNAKIAVVGYFPIISTKSDVDQISRYLFKAVSFPHPLQFGIANPFSKQFMKVLRKKMALRSELWVAESNRAFQRSIASVNNGLETDRIVFVPTPITSETCFATERSMLWRTDKDNHPGDEMYAARKVECPSALAEIKYHHYGKLALRMCELAAIGHPNIEGSIAYANAIKTVVEPVLRTGQLDRLYSINGGRS